MIGQVPVLCRKGKVLDIIQALGISEHKVYLRFLIPLMIGEITWESLSFIVKMVYRKDIGCLTQIHAIGASMKVTCCIHIVCIQQIILKAIVQGTKTTIDITTNYRNELSAACVQK